MYKRQVLGGEGNAAAVLPSSREAVQDGNAQQVTFTFSETGEVSLRAFVFPAENFFEGWGPSEIPAAPGASAETSTEPTAESSDEPAAGSTDEPTGSTDEATSPDAPDTEVPAGTASDASSASAPANG